MGKLIKSPKEKTDLHSTVRTVFQKKIKRKRKSPENRESFLPNRAKNVEKGMRVNQSKSLENKIEESLKANKKKKRRRRKKSSMDSAGADSSLDVSRNTEKLIGKYVRPLETQNDQPVSQADVNVKKRRKRRRSKGSKLTEDNNTTGSIKLDKKLEVVNISAGVPETKKNRKQKSSVRNESLPLHNKKPIYQNESEGKSKYEHKKVKPDKEANDAKEVMEVVKKKRKRKRKRSTGNESIHSNSQENINQNGNKMNEQKSDVGEVRKEVKRLKKNNAYKKCNLTEESIQERNTSLENEKLKPKNDKKKNLSLREKMLKQLKSSRFRYINEQLYTVEGKIARKIFKNDPEAFEEYHQGYKQQVNKWPINPVDVIIKSIKNMPRSHVIADLGCGEAKIAATVKQKVHCFDLMALKDSVIPCDMAHVPLEDDCVDVVVFCLSLMGTNLQDYLLEANRILKTGGIMKIAEVESRFENLEKFISLVHKFGFKNVHQDISNDLFYFLDFKKNFNVRKKQKMPVVSLKPCLYKKR